MTSPLKLVGGGLKAGYAHGQAAEFGCKAVEDIVSGHDLQATLSHALGPDHRRPSCPTTAARTASPTPG